MLYSFATVAGLLFIPGVLSAIWSETEILNIVQKAILLPLISLLLTVGMYILNDLVDADLDKANGKKRPISSGLVSKRQAWIFIVSTNGMALLLSVITLNPISILFVLLMLAIGIMYSAPRIALMNRFVIKTVTIATYYCLCALLGVASNYGLDLAIENPATLIHSLLMLAIMIFISSTLNDLGDVDGDKAAGRRTVPIVIGKASTIRLAILLAACMIPLTWSMYLLTLVLGAHGSIITAVLTSLFAFYVTSRMAMMRKGLHDMESMRKHHKKLFPLHMILQSNLVIGGIILL
jgi:geranylgeranylglycerol-phosphate geranylgeranyltransferase